MTSFELLYTVINVPVMEETKPLNKLKCGCYEPHVYPLPKFTYIKRLTFSVMVLRSGAIAICKPGRLPSPDIPAT